ncbi:hypothetical protein [Diaminobutyricimonas sp. TR449]|uniref:hypothetical protein n=1 Tax=Diaminobutyricimonas sp. TR449 TaxID=2708076 RepID=UPI001AB04B6F|nr:hypothetical protein [Diaminobutyricimonas sp. TR449]
MQWWNDLVDWLTSEDGWSVLTTAVFPFLAILVAGIVAALIGRASTKRVITFQDRELKAAAVSALIGVGRKAASWNTLSTQEQLHYDNLIGEADARVRLLPVAGAAAAADWAAHQLAEMKKNSAIFSFQAEQTLDEFRDRLVEWQHKPARARKQFKFDLEQWKYSQPTPEQELSVQQQEWAASNRAAQVAAAALPERTSTTPAAPAASPAAPTIASLATSRAADSVGDSTQAPARDQKPVTIHRDDVFAAPRSESALPTTAAPVMQPFAPASPSSAAGATAAPAGAAPASAAPANAATPVSPAEASDFARESATSTEGYSSPVTANTVRQRINPPTDD